MTRFDEVARLITIVPPTGIIQIAYTKDLIDAAPWLLEAAACFRPGDAEILRLMRNYLAAHKPDGHLLENGPSTACGVDCMARLLKAAAIMEGQE
jgi:hypothetical protein